MACAQRMSCVRVAHDDDLVAAQFFSQHVAAAFVCDGGNLIAIFTVVGERTGLKGVPKAERPV